LTISQLALFILDSPKPVFTSRLLNRATRGMVLRSLCSASFDFSRFVLFVSLAPSRFAHNELNHHKIQKCADETKGFREDLE